MATSLTISSIRTGVSWTYTNTLTPSDTTNTGSLNFSDNLSNGTAVDTADLMYSAEATITAGGTLNLDLAGSLTNFFGTTLTFARVKLFYLKFSSDNTASGVTIGNHAAPALLWFGAAAHTEHVEKTGFSFHYRADATGWPITATTADGIKIVNADGSNSAKIQILIVGCSA